MSDKKAFCEECRDEVHYTIKKVQMKDIVKSGCYTYEGKEAHCLTCGLDLFIQEVNDDNLRSLYDVFREKNGIISISSVLKIPEMYAIGKRPLSLLLGWGEQTFTRYCEGDLPTKQYSDILQRIYDDPNYYMEILERNKAYVKSDTTYLKSKKAVLKLVEKKSGEHRKIDQALEYLLWKCVDITPLALQKALYYIQGFYYAFHQTYIFDEECEAWVHGPVYRDIYTHYRDYRFDEIKQRERFDESVFSSSERAVLEGVVKYLCCYSGKVLETFTHGETPWLQTRKDLPRTTACDRKIPKEVIGCYFHDVKEKYKMKDIQDIKKYAQAKFDQIL